MDIGLNGEFEGKGKPMNPATFVYTLTVTFKNGDEHSEKGNIALVRQMIAGCLPDGRQVCRMFENEIFKENSLQVKKSKKIKKTVKGLVN